MRICVANLLLFISLYVLFPVLPIEMSERLGVTRQAAHDLVLRARDRLGEAESTLGLMKRIRLLEARIGELEERLKEATGGEKPCSML